jgi:hypothetical protein
MGNRLLLPDFGGSVSRSKHYCTQKSGCYNLTPSEVTATICHPESWQRQSTTQNSDSNQISAATFHRTESCNRMSAIQKYGSNNLPPRNEGPPKADEQT